MTATTMEEVLAVSNQILGELKQSARDGQLIQNGYYATEAEGRAAVADGETFKVCPGNTAAIFLYRRIGASNSNLIAELPTARGILEQAFSRMDGLAEERTQFIELIGQSNQEAISLLLARVQKLESKSQKAQMTAYALSHIANTAASVLVASGPVQRVQVLNRSSEHRVGIAFGAVPTSMDQDGLYVLEPGAALDTDLIAATPIYAIADGDAQLSGAFAVPQHEANPNWEGDFAALISGMLTEPSPAWRVAYSRLYSALRRERILSRCLGFYVFAAHEELAARQNWAMPGTYLNAVSAPVFSVKNGFVYDGLDDYHDSQLSMGGSTEQNPFTRSNDISAMLWPGMEDQVTGRVAMGDNVITIEANRSVIQAAMRTATTQADVIAIPGLGAPVGMVRVADERATAYVAGIGSSTVARSRITGYTKRNMLIGANNTESGAASFYAGTIRAAQFGKSLTGVQMLAMNAAIQRFFSEIKGI